MEKNPFENHLFLKTIQFIIAFFLVFNVFAQEQDQIEVMTLGVFHFDFPNLDVQQTGKENQINVYDEKHQKAIWAITKTLEEFRPTKILIERSPEDQFMIDSLYTRYLNDNYTLARDEDKQIGFRLAKALGLKKLYCVNNWGKSYPYLDFLTNGKDPRTKKFAEFYFDNPDKAEKFHPESVYKTKGIIAELIRLNSLDYIKKSLGNYLIGHFKYQTEEHPFFGVDFETGRWFNRNLRIFRNVQRVEATPDDRLLLIIGAGHLNLLNYLFEASPEYKLLSPIPYLKEAQRHIGK